MTNPTASGEQPAGAKRVAVATDGRSVAAHFGRCEAYTLADVIDGQIQSTQVIPNPGHEPGRLPRMLASLGVHYVLAGGMGMRAEALFAEAGITSIAGVQGPVSGVLNDFAAGRLTAGQSLCEHEEQGRGGRSRRDCEDQT